MSYYNQSHYSQPQQQQPPLPPPPSQQSQSPPQQQYQTPPQQYTDGYGSYQQQPGQNGVYGGHYAPQQPQQQSYYPGQQHYQSMSGGGTAGGPVQQPQSGYSDGHHSPRSGGMSGGPVSGGYSPAAYQYNPGSYNSASPQLPPPPAIPAYNPQVYANVNQSPNLTQHSQHQPFGSISGPVDPYAYNRPSPGYPPDPSYANASTGFSSNSPYLPQGSSHSGSLPPTPRYGQHNSPQVPQHTTPYSYQSASVVVPTSDPYAYRPPGTTVSPIPVAPDNRPWAASPSYGDTDSQNAPSPLYPNPTSPPSTTPGPTPPAHGSTQPVSTDRHHPNNRPLPIPDEESYFQQYGTLPTSGSGGGGLGELFDDVENMVMGTGRAPAAQAVHSPSISITQSSYHPALSTPPLFSSERDSHRSPNGTTTNGHLSPLRHGGIDHQLSEDSDPEAAAGMAMLQAAEADDRLQGNGQTMFGGYGGSNGTSRQTGREPTRSDSEEDYATMDMTSFGGGFDVPISYGSDPNQFAGRTSAAHVNGSGAQSPPPVPTSQQNSIRRSHASQSSRGEYDYDLDAVHPFPPFTAARVDAGGTGGLAEPTGRRQSFDEGDELSLMDGGNLPDRFPDEPPNIGFRRATASFRPLPAPPPDGSSTPGDLPSPYTDMSMSFPGDSVSTSGGKSLPPVPGHSQYQQARDNYMVNAQGQYVPRSSSVVGYTNTPSVVQPLRSKTDAEDRRARAPQFRAGLASTMESTASATGMPVDLPAIGKRFNAAKLGTPEFDRCEAPWALSALLQWLLHVTNPVENTELKEADVKEALVALFTHKVPTMNITDAEVLSMRVVTDMYEAGALVTTEEWVKIVSGSIVTGVIFQLTMSGCYSQRVHDTIIPNMRCYSRLCQRTLKKVNLLTHTARSSEGWAEFYKLTKEDYEHRDKKDIERQNILHEIVSSEELFMESLDTLRGLFRDSLATIEPSVLRPEKRDRFIRDVFGCVDAVKQANEDHLLAQLKYRQQEQGPWIVGFSDIFRQWIRKARTAYIDYITAFPRADSLVRQEMDRNMEFRAFVERARLDKRSNRLSLDNFLKSPITRLQRYGFLMKAVLKTMKTADTAESKEKAELEMALKEVEEVTKECDDRMDQMQKKIDLQELGTKLVFRPQLKNQVELNLDHFGRKLIHRGELQRMGGTRFTWLDCYALLFDNYFVLAKIDAPVDPGARIDKYDVSRMPIPMDLLVLDSANEPSVQKSSYVKGISTVTPNTGRPPNDPALLGRVPSTQSPAPGLAHVNTGSSANSLQTVTSLNDSSERTLFPFKVKHLGRETYTLFAPSEQARLDWCIKIVEAKTKHAAALHAQNAEPFRLRVMADSAFVMDSYAGSGKGIVIKGTPVDRAIKEVEHRFRDTGRPAPICRARVNCATTFTTPHPSKQMVAVGTDYGVYISELDNPRGWIRAISMTKVTQVAVLEEFNLFLLIAERALIAYHLDVVCPSERNSPAFANDSTRHAPQKLSGSRDVGFFVMGKMKDRTLVFYKKREGMNSVFKVLEPVYQKSTEKKRGIFKRGTTEFFREYDEFYIPAESSGMNLFHSSLAVSTSRGFEVLTLDKKQSWSVPELKAEHVQNIAAAIKDQKALGMLRLSDQEFLLCYERNAVYVNKHGDVSRSVIMTFVGASAQAAALYGPYLVLFNDDFVEVRNAQNGRLKQIIAGREVKCLDDGSSWPPNSGNAAMAAAAGVAPRTLKLVMQHPEIEKTQIVVELLLNENMKE